MPLQSIISRDAFNAIDRTAAAGNPKARELVSYFVGQGAGLIDSVKSAACLVQELKEDFILAIEHMNTCLASCAGSSDRDDKLDCRHIVSLDLS